MQYNLEKLWSCKKEIFPLSFESINDVIGTYFEQGWVFYVTILLAFVFLLSSYNSNSTKCFFLYFERQILSYFSLSGQILHTYSHSQFLRL